MLHSLQRENIHILLFIKLLLSNLDKKQTLKKFYKSDSLLIDEYYYTNIACQSFCFLLDFVYKHNPNLIENIDKPALSALWPNKVGMSVVLDLGANIECDEKNLVDFAELGSALHKSLFLNEKQRVALLMLRLLTTGPDCDDKSL